MKILSSKLKPFGILLMLLSVFFCSSCSDGFVDKEGAFSAKSIFRKRDVSKYEKGGLFYCQTWRGSRKENAGEKSVCDFIVKHLEDKRLGYIKLNCNGIDAVSTSHIFVEPDAKGEWRLSVRTVIKQMPAGGDYYVVSDEKNYKSVQCIVDYLPNERWNLFYVNDDNSTTR